jgi:RimJ/RimL family protein N-acetyltransferase
MATDETANVNAEERLTQSESLMAALAADDSDDLGGDDDSGIDAPIKGLSAKEVRTTLARGQADESDDDEDEDEEVDLSLPGKPEDAEEEDEDEPAGDDLTKELFEKAKAKGFDVDKYQDADAFLDGVVNLVGKLGERDQLAAYGKQLLDDPVAVYKHLEEALVKSGKMPAKAVAPTEAAKPRSDRPEFDEKWIEQLFNPDGSVKENADKTIARKFAVWQDWSAKEQRRLLNDPREMLKPVFEEDFKKIAADTVAAEIAKLRQEQEQLSQLTQAQQQELAQARELMAKDAGWVFVEGDQRKGLTPMGKTYKKWIDYAEQKMPHGGYRIPDINDRREFARAQTYAEFATTASKDKTAAKTEAKQRLAKKPVRASGKKSKSFFNGKSLEQALLEGLSQE